MLPAFQEETASDGLKFTRHCTEKLAYDREVQRQREQAELMQGKKERDAYISAVHKV